MKEGETSYSKCGDDLEKKVVDKINYTAYIRKK